LRADQGRKLPADGPAGRESMGLKMSNTNKKGPESGRHGPLWREAASGGRLLDGESGASGFSLDQDPEVQE